MSFFGDTLSSLPFIFVATLSWFSFQITSHFLSRSLFPKTYNSLEKKKQTQWNIRVVSLIHSVIVSLSCLYLLVESELSNERVFGHSHSASIIFTISCSYFLWDTLVTLYNFQDFGFGFLIHGVSCFLIYFFVFKPLFMYYGLCFLLYEMSTPFLNINWFFDKFQMTGTIPQLFNGIILVLTFGFIRLIFGFFISLQFYLSVFEVLDQVEPFFIALYSIANIVLNSLNVYWFTLMIPSVIARFSSPKKVE